MVVQKDGKKVVSLVGQLATLLVVRRAGWTVDRLAEMWAFLRVDSKVDRKGPTRVESSVVRKVVQRVAKSAARMAETKAVSWVGQLVYYSVVALAGLMDAQKDFPEAGTRAAQTADSWGDSMAAMLVDWKA